MSILTRPILEINLDNLVENFLTLQKISGKATAAAVVKDDAYGLGAQKVTEVLYRRGKCRHFFVAHAMEGQLIRQAAPDAQIYVLQGMGDDSIKEFENAGLVPVISSPQQLEYWKNHHLTDVKPVINIETGLNRLGFREFELSEMCDEDRKKFSMVMSHLACGDAQGHFMNQHQLDMFNYIRETYFPKLPASLSASDGTFLGEDYLFDLVRLGAAIYGINTAPYRENQMKNVVTLKAPVLQITDLPQGEFVGYSATYRANANRKIAIVSIGYGDGIPRSLSNVGKVFFNLCDKLHEARILGRVSMDNIICDVSDIHNLQVGDMAHLLADFYTPDDMGRDAATIGYEILSRIGKNPRFIRKYKGTIED